MRIFGIEYRLSTCRIHNPQDEQVAAVFMETRCSLRAQQACAGVPTPGQAGKLSESDRKPGKSRMKPIEFRKKSQASLRAVEIYSERRLDEFAREDVLSSDELASSKALLDRFNRWIGRRTENLPSGLQPSIDEETPSGAAPNAPAPS